MAVGYLWLLREPHPPFLAAGLAIANESPRDSYVEATLYDFGTLLPVTKNENYTEEEPVALPLKLSGAPFFSFSSVW
jgi:hypothetical protein